MGLWCSLICGGGGGVEVGGGGGGGGRGGGDWREKRRRLRRGEQTLEDIGQCLCQEEVSQTFFNERSVRKQTNCNTQTFVRVCATQT
ncbi:hypothetical protein Hanom_Chr04g00371421 [Helianthus anomalus]